MKKNAETYIVLMCLMVITSFAIYFFYCWRDEAIKNLRLEEKVAQLAETVSGYMKTGRENFERQEFLRRAGVENLLVENLLLEAAGGNGEEVGLEINKRLLGYPREIDVAESRRELIQKLLQSPTGKVYLASFMAEAKETIRIYEEERGRKWK